MTRSLNQQIRDELSPFAEHVMAMHQDAHQLIAPMTDDELQTLIDHARQATTTNCGWHTYRAAQFILEQCQVETLHRART